MAECNRRIAAEVADRREARHDRRAPVFHGMQRRIGEIIGDGRSEHGGSELAREVRVQVHETGQQRDIAEIDDARARRDR